MSVEPILQDLAQEGQDVQEEAPQILVVDDEKVIREILKDFLTMEGFSVDTVGSGEEAIGRLQERSYNLVISDLKMPRVGGLEVLERINELGLNVLTVIMTGFGTVESAIQAMKRGAYDYILKPFKVEEVVHVVRRGLDRQRLQLENMRLKEALSVYRISGAISQSLSLDHILQLIVDMAIEELRADAVTLLLESSEGSRTFVERIRRDANGNSLPAPALNVAELTRCYSADVPVLVHGKRSHRFFTEARPDRELVSFCSIPLSVRHRVLGILNAYSFTPGHKFSEGQRKMLSIMANRAAVSIENAQLYENLVASNRELETANRSLEENLRQTIVGFANALEESDRYTRGHSERVSVYARIIAEGMDLGPQHVDRVVLSAKVHDIGKIGIPTDKLNKPGGLTLEERDLLRCHPEKGKRILEPVPFLRDLIPGAYCHHEAYDGSGYPQGLCGEGIPILGRIIAVADAYDAMTSDRAYRRALSREMAIEELSRGGGSQFDPNVVAAFVRELKRRHSQTAEALRLVVSSHTAAL